MLIFKISNQHNSKRIKWYRVKGKESKCVVGRIVKGWLEAQWWRKGLRGPWIRRSYTGGRLPSSPAVHGASLRPNVPTILVYTSPVELLLNDHHRKSGHCEYILLRLCMSMYAGMLRC